MFKITEKKIEGVIAVNKNRFPNDFLTRITNWETEIPTTAFTIAGSFMLADQLKSDRTIKISLQMVELLVERKPNTVINLIKDNEK